MAAIAHQLGGHIFGSQILGRKPEPVAGGQPHLKQRGLFFHAGAKFVEDERTGGGG
jgi:hypothetical protein